MVKSLAFGSSLIKTKSEISILVIPLRSNSHYNICHGYLTHYLLQTVPIEMSKAAAAVPVGLPSSLTQSWARCGGVLSVAA